MAQFWEKGEQNVEQFQYRKIHKNMSSMRGGDKDMNSKQNHYISEITVEFFLSVI